MGKLTRYFIMEILKLLDNVIIDFTKINPKFVKRIHVTFTDGSEHSYRLSDFIDSVAEEDILTIEADIRYDMIEQLVNNTLEQINRRCYGQNHIYDSSAFREQHYR